MSAPPSCIVCLCQIYSSINAPKRPGNCHADSDMTSREAGSLHLQMCEFAAENARQFFSKPGARVVQGTLKVFFVCFSLSDEIRQVLEMRKVVPPETRPEHC